MMHRGFLLLSLALCVIGSQSRHRALFRRDSGGGDTTVSQTSNAEHVTAYASNTATAKPPKTMKTAPSAETTPEPEATAEESPDRVAYFSTTSGTSGSTSEPEASPVSDYITWFTSTMATPYVSFPWGERDYYDEDFNDFVKEPTFIYVSLFADRVQDVSSEYGDMWSADTILGEPDVYPRYGDFPGSWQQLSDSSKAEEWIIVEMGTAMFVDRVALYETYNSGRVIDIALATPYGCWFSGWRQHNPEFLNYSRRFEPEFQNYPDFMSNTVKITTKPSAMGWVNLDSVEVYGVAYYDDIYNIYHDDVYELMPFSHAKRARGKARSKSL